MKRGFLSSIGIHISHWFAAVAAGLFCIGQQARGADFQQVEFEGASYLIKKLDPSQAKLSLFLNDTEGKPLNHFDGVNQALKKEGRRLRWAMNAGMYHGNFRPVGLCVIDGKEISPINFTNNEKEGNFFLKPNGVFAIRNGKGVVLESTAYASAGVTPELATQSGPMLVIDGRIHPRFVADSKSKLHRNGVGIMNDGRVVFAITETPVNFYTFARFFRDHLGCKNALFLDGTICSLYSRSMHRNDFRMNLGPIIGEVEPDGAQ